MKTAPVILSLALLTATFSSCKEPPDNTPLPPQKPNPEQQAKINQLQSALEQQSDATKRWQTIALSLGAGCFVLLILGTALGAKTRHDASSS